MKALFYQPTHASNIGMIIRSAVGFNIEELIFYDPKNILSKKAKQIYRVSQGTIKRIKITTINDIPSYLSTYTGRKIATVCEGPATSLKDLVYQENDLLIFGNERGLPQELIELCDLKVNIPLQNLNSLNLACAFSIFAYTSQTKL
jgi:tRNA G18 (ribose-2'-O)-methylase SpoU